MAAHACLRGLLSENYSMRQHVPDPCSLGKITVCGNMSQIPVQTLHHSNCSGCARQLSRRRECRLNVKCPELVSSGASTSLYASLMALTACTRQRRIRTKIHRQAQCICACKHTENACPWTCVHEYMYIYIYIYIGAYIQTCIHVYVYIYIHAGIYTYVPMYIHTYIHICICVHIHILVHVHMHIITHIYTHKHVCVLTSFPANALDLIGRHVSTQLHINTSICMSVCTCIYICTYTDAFILHTEFVKNPNSTSQTWSGEYRYRSLLGSC